MSDDSENEQQHQREIVARAYYTEPDLNPNDPYRNTSLEGQGSTADTSNFDEQNAPCRHHGRNIQHYGVERSDFNDISGDEERSANPPGIGVNHEAEVWLSQTGITRGTFEDPGAPEDVENTEWSESEDGGFRRYRSVDEVRSRRERRAFGLPSDGEEDESEEEQAAVDPAESYSGDEDADDDSAESSSGDEEVDGGAAPVARPIDDGEGSEHSGNEADDES